MTTEITMITQPADREIVPDVSLADLDLELVTKTMQNGYDLGRYKGPIDPEAYLLRFGGIIKVDSTLYPTVAGVLAFTHEPDRWLTASGIDIATYSQDQTNPTRANVSSGRHGAAN